MKTSEIPIKVASRLFSAIQKFGEYIDRKHKMLRCNCAPTAFLFPTCRIENGSRDREKIVIGKDSRVLGHLTVYLHGGSITVGSSCFIGENTRIWSAQNISIGNRVLISHSVNIHDNISHSLSAASRHNHFKAIFSSGHPESLDIPKANIVIEDDAWIGFGAAVMKGVTIGRGAVIGAHSVITKDVPAYTVVVGNPARVVGTSHA